MNIHRRTES